MKRSERKIYCKCIAIMAVYIISAVWFYTMPCNSEKCPIDGLEESDGKIIEETHIVAETGQIRENTAMLRKVGEVEQETSEEVEDSVRCEDGAEVPKYEAHLSVSETETPEIQADVRTDCPIYQVDGQLLNHDLQEYLYQRLAENSMEWFFPYSILICYQESRFNIYAENPNGLDKGLFQYRITYYPGQNIFDPYEQIDIFVQQMANRSQYDVYEMISRHNVSDFGSYNATYVSQVMAHESNLRKVN